MDMKKEKKRKNARQQKSKKNNAQRKTAKRYEPLHMLNTYLYYSMCTAKMQAFCGFRRGVSTL